MRRKRLAEIPILPILFAKMKRIAMLKVEIAQLESQQRALIERQKDQAWKHRERAR
jgi:hypothetical protein